MKFAMNNKRFGLFCTFRQILNPLRNYCSTKMDDFCFCSLIFLTGTIGKWPPYTSTLPANNAELDSLIGLKLYKHKSLHTIVSPFIKYFVQSSEGTLSSKINLNLYANYHENFTLPGVLFHIIIHGSYAMDAARTIKCTKYLIWKLSIHRII